MTRMSIITFVTIVATSIATALIARYVFLL